MTQKLFDKVKPKINTWVLFGYTYEGRKYEDQGRLTDISYGKVTIKSENFHDDFWILNISSLLYIKN